MRLSIERDGMNLSARVLVVLTDLGAGTEITAARSRDVGDRLTVKWRIWGLLQVEHPNPKEWFYWIVLRRQPGDKCEQ